MHKVCNLKFSILYFFLYNKCRYPPGYSDKTLMEVLTLLEVCLYGKEGQDDNDTCVVERDKAGLELSWLTTGNQMRRIPDEGKDDVI